MLVQDSERYVAVRTVVDGRGDEVDRWSLKMATSHIDKG